MLKSSSVKEDEYLPVVKVNDNVMLRINVSTGEIDSSYKLDAKKYAKATHSSQREESQKTSHGKRTGDYSDGKTYTRHPQISAKIDEARKERQRLSRV
jgi:hypothetical protein